jgi:hypothetical protein
MTIPSWPPAGKPPRASSTRGLSVDPLPRSILHSLVSDLPGPSDETPSMRALRFQSQMAEVLNFKPRDSFEAMIACQCVMLRPLAEESRRDAVRPDLSEANKKQCLQSAKQLDRLIADMKKALTKRQAKPLGDMDPMMFEALGLGQFLIREHPAGAHEAEDRGSFAQFPEAIIVPTHSAPKLLQ